MAKNWSNTIVRFWTGEGIFSKMIAAILAMIGLIAIALVAYIAVALLPLFILAVFIAVVLGIYRRRQY